LQVEALGLIWSAVIMEKNLGVKVAHLGIFLHVEGVLHISSNTQASRVINSNHS